MHTKLFIPGPVDVREDVLEKMSMPQIGHRTKEASELQRRISENMQKIWKTKEQILLSTSSGSGLMEGAIKSCTRKRAAVFSIGTFGTRWYEMAVNNNVEADLFETVKGKATDPDDIDRVLSMGKYDLLAITHNETSTGIANPIDEIAQVMKRYPDVVFCVDMVSSAGGHKLNVDELGIDIAITSSQKCLGIPAGLSICTFSEKAIERAKTVKNRGYYFDLLNIYMYILKKDYQYPSTPSIPHMFALDYQLDYILNVEGIENRFKRHIDMAEIVQNWVREKFDLFGDETHLSRTVTAVKNVRNINVSDLNNELIKRGMMISNGYGDLKEKTFRIAHMADTQIDDINELLNNINDILGIWWREIAKMKILANDGLDINAVKKFEDDGIEVDTRHYEDDELLKVIKDYDVLIVRSATKVNKEVIDASIGTRLKLVIRAGVGLDNIDVRYANKVGIEVRNTPNSSSNSVAELVLGHMLALSRFISVSKLTMSEGIWNKKAYTGVDIFGKTIGIIGFGRIGKLLAQKASALGMKVMFYDKFIKEDKNYQYYPMEEVLKKADYISLHVPSTEKPLIGEKEISLMKDGVFIINAARGGIIDEEALLNALNSDKISGVGLDVYINEPNPNIEICRHPKVSCTPHIGAATVEAQERIGEEIVEIIDEFCKQVKDMVS